jgi:cyclic beta-1,2-glucan synthetase
MAENGRSRLRAVPKTWILTGSVENFRATRDHGFRVIGDTLLLDPCIPRAWGSFEIAYRRGATRYRILVQNPQGRSRGVVALELDGVSLACAPPAVPLVADGGVHEVRVVLG